MYMKLSIFSNDKTIAKDEVVLALIALISLLFGVLLLVFKPSLWLIESNDFIILGVILIMIATMFAPCIIYRFATNNKLNNK